MAGDEKQIERLIRILQLLSMGGKIKINDLYNRFDRKVSKRTLQRDLLSLSNANIPIISKKDRANENIWYLHPRFKSFIPIPLGLNEYLAANILKENLKIFKHTSFDEEINSLIKKIEQIVPEEVFLETQEMKSGEIFENYSAGDFDYSPYGIIINDIIKAIINHRKCQIKYLVPGREHDWTYKAEPEKMVYYNGGLYVIVYMRSSGRFILFAIQRIKKIEVSDEKFPNDHAFNAKKFWSGRFGMFSGDKVNVKLKFSKKVKHHINGRLWHPSQKIEIDKEGNLILSMKVGMTPELITWILGWRFFVEVLAPQDLIDEIKLNIEKMREIY